MNKKIISAISVIITFFVVVSCQQSKLEQEVIIDSIGYGDASFNIIDIDLYKKSGYNSSKNTSLQILDADEERILYAIQNRYNRKDVVSEGILSQTQEIGVFNYSTSMLESVYSLTDSPIPQYVYQGTLSSDSFLLLSINLDQQDNTFRIYYENNEILETVYEGCNTKYFTMWPLLEPILLGGNDTKTKLMRFSGTDFVDITPKWNPNGRLLESKVASDGERMMTLWTNNESAYFIINDSKNILYTVPFPNQYKLLDYALNKDGIVMSLRSTTNEKSYIQFIRLANMQPITAEFLDIYRMTGNTQESTILGVSSTFQPYILETKGDMIKQTSIENGGHYELTMITAVGDGQFLLNQQEQLKIVKLNLIKSLGE